MIVIEKFFGRAARLELGNKLLFFIFATLFITVNAPSTFAQQESTRMSSGSANQVAVDRNTKTAIPLRQSLKSRNTACLKRQSRSLVLSVSR